MADIIIVQASLSKNSNTEIVAKETKRILDEKKIDHEYVDLKDFDIEFCDGRTMDEYNEKMRELYKKLESAKGYILAYPIYNFSFSGVLKNFIDIFSYPMDSKYVGLINNSSGVRSWNQGTGELMKVLALHNRITVVQPTVHTSQQDFKAEKIDNEKVYEKLDSMIDKLVEVSIR